MTKSAWQKWASREGVDLTTLCEVDRVFYELILEYTGEVRENFFTTLSNRVFTHYVALDCQAMGRFLYRKYLGNDADIDALIFRGEKFIREAVIQAQKWSDAVLESNDKKTLISALKEFMVEYPEVNKIFSIMSFYAIESWQKDFQDVFTKMIDRNGLEGLAGEVSDSVLTPWRRTPLMELGERLASGESAEKLAIDYQYLRSWSMVWNTPIGKDWVLSLKTNEKKFDAGRKKTAEYISMLKPDSEELWFLEIAPRIVYFKDWRDALRRKHVYVWSFLFDEIARELSMSRDDLGYLTLEEMTKSLMSGGVDKQVVSDRRDSIAVVTSKVGQISMQIVSGKDLNKYLKIVEEIESGDSRSVVTGLVAQKGKIVGKVQVINLSSDVATFREGSILVSNSTHPNYLSAMHKASAIVTNEGGVACHAAIVAREMKIPCIVGTEIATKVLKDGMTVEVDANTGTVRIVE